MDLEITGLKFKNDENTYVITDAQARESIENLSADSLAYTNDNFEDIENINDALNKLFSKVYYVNPSCSLSASPAGGTFEIGTVIEGVDFSWTVNKEITSQTLTDCTIELADRTASYENNISSNKSFTLRVSDGTNAATSSVSYSFQPKVYYGSAAVPNTYDSAFCMGLTSSALKSSKAGTYALNVAANEYGFICMPKSFANIDTLIAKVGGFDTEIPRVATVSHTNAKGYTQDYNIFKTANSNLGSISAIIS